MGKKRNNKTLKLKPETIFQEEPGFLEPEVPLERTKAVTQSQIKELVDIQTSQKIFDLELKQLGPYTLNYSRNGKFLALAGKKGHVALLEWRTKRLLHELWLNETVTDIQTFHNETLYAVGQRKQVYIYDNKGIEIHCLKDLNRPVSLDFLPYHFLLVSLNSLNQLKYLDITTGEMAGSLNLKTGTQCMKHNPYNGVVSVGQSNGVVSMWSPKISKPLVKVFTHKAPVNDIAFDIGGNVMVTSGLDSKVKVWDIRNWKELYDYPRKGVYSIDISQRGLLALAKKNCIEIFKNVKEKSEETYMFHEYSKKEIKKIQFCPYEDILGIGHSGGFSSIVIPGSGEPNFDTFEANPYETKKQRQESEVKKLLEKLKPEMIALDPNFVGSVLSKKEKKEIEKEEEEEKEKEEEEQSKKKKSKNKAKGRNSTLKRESKKQSEHWEKKKVEIRKKFQKKLENEDDEEHEEQEDKNERKRNSESDGNIALSRFKKRKFFK